MFTQKYRQVPTQLSLGICTFHIHPLQQKKKNADKQQRTRGSYLKHKKNIYIALLKTLN